MPLRTLGALLLCLVLAGLAILVVSRDPRAQANRLFAVLIATIIGWITSVTLALGASDPQEIVLRGRWIYAFASAMPFALLCLLAAFPGSLTPPQARRLLIPGFACVASIAAAFSPWVVTGATAGRPGADLVYGPLHPGLAAYIVLCLAAAVHVLWRKTKAATGIAKLQLRYLLLGIFFGSFGIVTTNLAVPLLWRSSSFSVLGPYFTLVFASFCAHAIIRHRLMDIRIVVRRGVVYASAVALTCVLVVATALVIDTLTGQQTRELPLSTALGLAILFAIVFEPLRRQLNDAFDRYFYRPAYDYSRTVREASRQLGTTLHLQAVLSYLADLLDHTTRPEMVTLYLRESTSDQFQGTFFRHSDASAAPIPFLDASSSLIRHLEQAEVIVFARSPEPTRREGVEAAAEQELAVHGAELAFALRHDHRLCGALLLGSKRSGDPYFSNDLDLLTTLVNQAAIAIKNAQLYSEVVLANRYIENIVSAMESGVIAVAPTGVVTLVNAAAARMTRRALPEVKGHPLTTLPAPLAGALAGTLTDDSPRSNLELTLGDELRGGSTPVVCSTSILRDEAGARLGVVAVFSDLTAIKQLETDKRRVERLAAVGALTAGIAHEIKNPLVAIRTFAELLPERFSDDEFRSSFSQLAIREIQRIDSLVARLGGLAVPISPRLKTVDVRDAVEETLDLLRARLEQAHIAVKREYGHDVPAIVGDHDQLKQLFLNLFINAADAIGSEGEVTVTIHRRDSAGGSVLVVTIRDTGPGLPESIAGTVFEPFVSGKPHGSGLGLSICRGIADAHRATIRLENNVAGPGASATVEFSISEERRPDDGQLAPSGGETRHHRDRLARIRLCTPAATGVSRGRNVGGRG